MLKEPVIKYIKHKEPSLKEMQTFVGGYIQMVMLGDDRMMILDEEGKMKGKAENVTATDLAHEHNAIFETDYIAGDVMILSGEAMLS